MYDVEIELEDHIEEYSEITLFHIPNDPAESIWVNLEDKDKTRYFIPVALIKNFEIRYSEESKKPFGL